jgi:hypothetical protein
MHEPLEIAKVLQSNMKDKPDTLKVESKGEVASPVQHVDPTFG